MAKWRVVAVTGGRKYSDYMFFKTTMDEIHTYEFESGIDLLVIGDATGADSMAESWAKSNRVNFMKLFAKWGGKAKKGAGHARNADMLKRGEPELLVAFPGGNGTNGMVEMALKKGIRVIDHRETGRIAKEHEDAKGLKSLFKKGKLPQKAAIAAKVKQAWDDMED